MPENCVKMTREGDLCVKMEGKKWGYVCENGGKKWGSVLLLLYLFIFRVLL
jgi:hypothetical protein